MPFGDFFPFAGLPVALAFAIGFFIIGGLGAIYVKAYGIGVLLFVILFFGITVRVATTVRRREEGRALVEFFEVLIWS
eukprot:SAG31_NODE_13261_length_881_cov_11.663683_1_plen_78_part_00